VELRTQTQALADALDEAVGGVLDSGWFITGPSLKRFEHEFASYLGRQYAIGVGTGTDAISITLRCLGVGNGDEVITVANTVFATARAITVAGATPRFVDVDWATGQMDPAAVAEAISPRTRAIVPVHLYGNPCAIETLVDLASAHGIPVVEDACQAAGARAGGKYCGTFGVAGCFSFYPSKNLGGYGDGGMIVTDDEDLAQKARAFRFYGQVERDVFESEGVNSRLDELQAAMLSVKLPHLDSWNSRRRRIADTYDAAFAQLQLAPLQTEPRAEANRHLYVLRSPCRDAIRSYLQQHGIQTEVHYRAPLHLLPVFGTLDYAPGMLPVTERHCREVFSLPMYPEMTALQIAKVVEAVTEACAT
jgi:dTDP-4-amino-4,6-dideoxygalactose transaminase